MAADKWVVVRDTVCSGFHDHLQPFTLALKYKQNNNQTIKALGAVFCISLMADFWCAVSAEPEAADAADASEGSACDEGHDDSG